MKAKLSYKSKRNIIIAGIITVLLAGISTAGYFYIKGNDDTAQAFTENNTTIGDTTTNGEQENLNLENPQNNNGQTTTPGGTEGDNPQNQGETTNEGTTNQGTTDQTTGDVPNQDYVTETIERVETLVSEDYTVEWQPISVQANTTTRNLGIIRPIITANKTADKTAVVVGETITYTITVQNKGNADGVAIVKDNVPEGTTFVEGSIKVNNEETNYTAEDLSNGIQVNVAKQNEQGENGKAVISFQVIVNEKVENNTDKVSENVIANKATVNEKETEEVKNPVVTYSKHVDKPEVKVGEKLTYTITVTNTSEVEGTVVVKDEVPEGTTFVDGSIKVNNEETNYTAEDLEEGIQVYVPAKETATVEFKATANDLNDGDKITNTAYVNGKPSTSEETKYQEPIISAKKESNKTAVVAGEELTYTITVTNSGSIEGTVTVQDSAPEGTTYVENGNVTVTINGETTTREYSQLEEGFDVTVPAGKTATVSFTVTVDKVQEETEIENTVGTITNTATVNGEETDSVKTPVFTTNKTVSGTTQVTDTEGNVKETAKAGDILTYTIEVANIGELEGTVTVQDSAPKGTAYVENGNVTVTINGETTTKAYSELEEGIDVTVPAGKTATVSFQVKVTGKYLSEANEEGKVEELELADGATIANTAYVNGQATETTETEYQKPVISAKKESNKTAVVAGEE
ncbi:MAG: hypothetical protein ACI4UU_02455, partial [Clostridia bacterium]